MRHPLPFTADEFLTHCKRRFGTANPEHVASPVWEWMVRTRHTPYLARKELGLAQDYGVCGRKKNPDWCFSRMGMPTVDLADGRRLSIAGEHEDWYDPNFCIYNDVVVERDGDVKILCYPREVFPPTDFHSATLIGGLVWIVGALGYHEDRQTGGGETPVFTLDTDTYQIRGVAVSGPSPARVHKHRARLLPDGFTIEIARGETVQVVDDNTIWRTNTDVHHLDTQQCTWRLLTDTRAWRQLRIRFKQRFDTADFGPRMAWYTGDVLRALPYSLTPAGDTDSQEDGSDDRVHTLTVQGVSVRITDEYQELIVVVEGELPPLVVERLVGELRSLLEATNRPVTEVEYS